MAHQLTRSEPFGDLLRMEPLRGVEDFFRDLGFRHALRDIKQPAMRLDVTENDKAYTVNVEVPGFKKEEIKVDVDGKRVTISAETQRETGQKKGDVVICNERYVGQQYRSFTLDKDVDEAKAVASYKDGVLELTLPKRQGGRSTGLTIS